ncbi:MAG: GAF domain-containing protein [Chloroflexi bacterium]|nr:GAF domain-containing protein [Chloroflexota bacterium]
MLRQSEQISHQIITYKLLRAIGESLEPVYVAYTAVSTVIDLMEWLSATILTPNHDGALIVRAAMGIQLTDQGVNGRAFRTGDTQVVDNIIGESDIGPTYQTTYHALAVPILRGKWRVGVFNIENDQPFTQDDVLLAGSMAEVIGLALDNAELYAQSQRRLAAQTALQEAASTIASTLDLPVVLNRIAEQMGKAVQATSAYICGYDKATKTSTVLAEFYSDLANQKERVSDLGTVYYLPEDFPEGIEFLEEGQPAVTYVDDKDLTEGERDHLKQYDGRTILSIPLQIGGKTIAYAELWDSWQHRVFTDNELSLCQGIAQHAAIAIENARLFQAIEKEHGRLHALIEADDNGVILIGGSGNMLVINAGALSMLGLSGQPKEWVGRPLQKVIQNLVQISSEASQIVQHELNRFWEGDETIGEGEISIASRAFRWRNMPVMNRMVPLGRLITLHDITEQRTLEKIRDDLTHTMVHDLRGPLTSISISLDVLKMLEKSPELFSEKREQAIERVANSTKQLLFLVENILELSRLESGHLELDYQSVHLAEIVETVLEMETPVAKEKVVELSCEVADPLPTCWIDRDLIQRVLYNLVNNGVKFTTPHGRVHIRVQLPTSEPASLLITITDTGHGVSPEIQEQLFQKFSRGTEQARGSGLGLYFCRMVVEAHHGRIWLDHSDQTGSTFCLTLPLAVQ